MRRPPDDDLFQDSTMTFGEHLEELRGCLWRALAGLMIGFLIALIFASRLVQWIEVPLRNGLRQHYLEKAKEQLMAAGADASAATQWTMIDEQQMLPSLLHVDAESLMRQLHVLNPDRFEAPSLQTARLSSDELPLAAVGSVAQQLARAGRSRRATPVRAVWERLSAAQQQEVRQMAEATRPTPANRARLIVALNDVIESGELYRDSAFDKLESWLSRDERTEILSSMRASLQQRTELRLAQELNRQLLSTVFPDEIQHPQPKLLKLLVWQPIDVQVQALSVHEPFMVYLKAALVAGLVLASPWIFFQIWSFVAAGLYPHERKYVYVFLPFSLGLFLLGVSLAFCFVFEPVLNFLFSFNRAMNIDAEPRITDWISFVLLLPLGFGISFQLPLVMLFLERLGIFTVPAYLSRWRIAVLVIFVLSMFLTPADPISMLLMAVPLTMLYFGGVLLCRFFPRRKSPVT